MFTSDPDYFVRDLSKIVLDDPGIRVSGVEDDVAESDDGQAWRSGGFED